MVDARSLEGEFVSWRVKLDGYGVAISELERELDYLRGAKRYLEE